jgi:hypothetical protein
MRLLLTLMAAAGGHAAATCPAGFTLMAQTVNWTACEDLGQRTGSLIFLGLNGAQLAVLNKTAEHMFTNANLSTMKPPVPADGSDPTLAEIMDAAPPMVYAGEQRRPINVPGPVVRLSYCQCTRGRADTRDRSDQNSLLWLGRRRLQRPGPAELRGA